MILDNLKTERKFVFVLLLAASIFGIFWLVQKNLGEEVTATKVLVSDKPLPKDVADLGILRVGTCTFTGYASNSTQHIKKQ